jgi:hypothetical protein
MSNSSWATKITPSWADSTPSGARENLKAQLIMDVAAPGDGRAPDDQASPNSFLFCSQETRT